MFNTAGHKNRYSHNLQTLQNMSDRVLLRPFSYNLCVPHYSNSALGVERFIICEGTIVGRINDLVHGSTLVLTS